MAKGTRKFHLPILSLLYTCFFCVFLLRPLSIICACAFVNISGLCMLYTGVWWVCRVFSQLLFLFCASFFMLKYDLSTSFWFGFLSFLHWMCYWFFYSVSLSFSVQCYRHTFLSWSTLFSSLSLQCFLNVYSPKISTPEQLAKAQHGTHFFLQLIPHFRSCFLFCSVFVIITRMCLCVCWIKLQHSLPFR